MSDGLHLSARHREALEALLRSHLPGVEVWAYGSRANGAAHDGSDMDLVLRGSGLREIPARRLADFADAVRESSVPFLVEARDWAHLPERFHREIERGYIVLIGAGAREKHGWRKMDLGDCIEIVNSTLSPSEKWPFINYLDTGNITDNRISEIQRLTVGEDKIPSRARRKAGCGDIVYSTVRPNQRHYGLLRDIPRNFLVSTGFAVLRGRSGIAHTDFIYWFLTQDRVVDRLQTIAEHNTSAYPAIRPEYLELLPIDLPPFPEQRAIAGVLCALDDKIALNRRINETLEAMAQAVFEDWFVDFGPTRAKMEGREPYLAPELWSLFPDRLVDSRLGGLPEGWTVNPLSEAIELNPRRSLRKGKAAPYLDMANMPTKGHVPRAVVERPYRSGMRFVNGDTLVSRITPCLENGKIAHVDFLLEGEIGWGSTEYIVMRSKGDLPEEFVYYLARSAGFREFAVQNMTGTSGRQRVPATALSLFPFPVPPRAVTDGFRSLVRPLMTRISKADRESRVLAALRDSILPKLVSGELRVNVDDRPPGETVR